MARETRGQSTTDSTSQTGTSETGTNVTPPVAPTMNGGLVFEDAAEIPGAKQRSIAANPFADKVQELARTGRASKVTLPVSRKDENGKPVLDEWTTEWARDLIRRAATALNKGADTRIESIKDDDTRAHVWFTVRDKREKKTSKSA